jgi:four helix bundle protein
MRGMGSGQWAVGSGEERKKLVKESEMKKSECRVREIGSRNTAEDEHSGHQISSQFRLPNPNSPPPISSYRDLEVWQFSMQLAKEIYSITREFPKEELYGLTSQNRRASVSVPANIAEGYGRDNAGDYARFLQIAQGSLKEVETLLLLSCVIRSIQSRK